MTTMFFFPKFIKLQEQVRTFVLLSLLMKILCWYACRVKKMNFENFKEVFYENNKFGIVGKAGVLLLKSINVRLKYMK